MTNDLHRPTEDNQGTPPQGDDQPVECNCLTKIREELPAKIIHNNKRLKNLEVEDAEFETVAIFPEFRLYTEISYKMSFEKTDGTRSKPVTKKASMHFNYCPFCGAKNKTTGL